MAGLNIKSGRILAIEDENDARQFLVVEIEGQQGRAVNYLALGCPVTVGQEVNLNTTAVDLSLGSGGWHFVVPSQGKMSGPGHILKLRYTPLQLKIQAVEEQGSPWHQEFLKPGGLEGKVVLAAELHSMVAPLALSLKALDPGARIVCLITEGGALPVAFSNALGELKSIGVISGVVSCGSAFGGDLEAVNVFSGLQAAARVLEAQYIISAMGPGIAGTGSVFGFSGLEQGFVLQGAWALGGIPLLVPRLGFVDPRERHQGISHHTLTIARYAYGGPLLLPLPLLKGEQGNLLVRQARGLSLRIRVRFARGRYIGELAKQYPGLFASMGRAYRDNSPFFWGLGAAARVAWEAGGQV
jgi:hypothetical protein